MTELSVYGDPVVPSELLHTLSEKICEDSDPDTQYIISLAIVTSEEMKDYNRCYRGVDKPTDVLSFVNEVALGGFAADYQANVTGKQATTKLCDIIIDINQLDRQKEMRSLQEEFVIVFIHGMLHLVGYDHVSKQDTITMNIKEEYYKKMTEGAF